MSGRAAAHIAPEGRSVIDDPDVRATGKVIVSSGHFLPAKSVPAIHHDTSS